MALLAFTYVIEGSYPVAALLFAIAAFVFRLSMSSVEVRDRTVVVRNVFRTHHIACDDVSRVAIRMRYLRGAAYAEIVGSDGESIWIDALVVPHGLLVSRSARRARAIISDFEAAIGGA